MPVQSVSDSAFAAQEATDEQPSEPSEPSGNAVRRTTLAEFLNRDEESRT
jgi:hypothetical protein